MLRYRHGLILICFVFLLSGQAFASKKSRRKVSFDQKSSNAKRVKKEDLALTFENWQSLIWEFDIKTKQIERIQKDQPLDQLTDLERRIVKRFYGQKIKILSDLIQIGHHLFESKIHLTELDLGNLHSSFGIAFYNLSSLEEEAELQIPRLNVSATYFETAARFYQIANKPEDSKSALEKKENAEKNAEALSIRLAHYWNKKALLSQSSDLFQKSSDILDPFSSEEALRLNAYSLEMVGFITYFEARKEKLDQKARLKIKSRYSKCLKVYNRLLEKYPNESDLLRVEGLKKTISSFE